MKPDQPQARTIAKAAWERCEAEDWEGAVSLYEDALPLLDKSHWSTQDILGEYGLALCKIGRLSDQIVALTGALESALLVDAPLSLSVGIARHFLVDALIRQNRLAEAKGALLHWPDENVESPWLLNFSAAMLAFAEKDQVEFERRCNRVWESAPSGKWESLEELKEAVSAELRT